MSIVNTLSHQFNAAYLGPNFTAVSLKQALEDVSVVEAKTKIQDCNTILALTYHMHYYIAGVTQVLQGGTLDIRDKYSFDHPDLETEEDWKAFQEKIYAECKTFIDLVDAIELETLTETFVDEKYGNYLRNIIGLSEHFHYHLGQISLLKKLIRKQ